MFHRFLCLLFLSLTTCQLSAEQKYHYTGQLERIERGGSRTQLKEFSVNCVVASDDKSSAFYHLDETGSKLPWIERFGKTSKQDQILSKRGVAIGYRHLDRNYVLPVALPYFANFDKLEVGAAWKNDQGEFRVTGEKTVNDLKCWEVKATTGIARHHQLYVRQDSPIVEAGTQTVFMGSGDRFQMTFRLDQTDSETNETSPDLAAAIKYLLEMKTTAARSEHERFEPLSPENVKEIAKSRIELLAVCHETFLHSFAKEVDNNLTTVLSRKDRVDSLADSMLKNASPKFTLQTLQSKSISSSSLLGKTVVLHFWDYANPTLEQPYGQVGYLDFTHNRWESKGVVVYGVAVNSQLIDAQTREAAIREIERLKQFMKLSYEITFDAGAVLNSFGNPTRLGEELPLWVVISPEGKVVHYQTGFYEVDNRVGLKALDQAIEAAIQ